jgi:hypothetical protein
VEVIVARYFKGVLTHQSEKLPEISVYEIDDDNWETRKVEQLSNGNRIRVDREHPECDGKGLSDQPMEIETPYIYVARGSGNKLEVFEISEAEFLEAWNAPNTKYCAPRFPVLTRIWRSVSRLFDRSCMCV